MKTAVPWSTTSVFFPSSQILAFGIKPLFEACSVQGLELWWWGCGVVELCDQGEVVTLGFPNVDVVVDLHVVDMCVERLAREDIVNASIVSFSVVVFVVCGSVVVLVVGVCNV